ncbi:MAG: hypothetical protein Q8R78_00960 [Candidatus Omnitrophota bacterium]|nr:hypothetical protein [Candidatus Omnitrophota bacterium]
MPSRIIRDSIRTSPTLDELSDGAERMFWRLVTVADDYGRFEADPRVLLSQCFPLRVDRLKVKQIAEWFEEMVKTDLARCYQVNGRTYGYFPTWEKYQRIRAKESRYPAPPSARNAPHEPASAAESDDMPPSADICPQDADIGEHPPRNAPVVKGYGVRGIEDTPSISPPGGKPHTNAAKTSRKTRIPHEFQVTEAMQAWADEKAPTVDLLKATEQFIDYHRAKGSLWVDWIATWQTWIRNARDKYGGPFKTAPPVSQKQIDQMSPEERQRYIDSLPSNSGERAHLTGEAVI